MALRLDKANTAVGKVLIQLVLLDFDGDVSQGRIPEGSTFVVLSTAQAAFAT